MKLTEREKIAHLYRRFSFGGTVAEIDAGVAAGFEATLKQLVDYDTVPSGFPVHPYEFFFKEKDEAEFGAYRLRTWWIAAMATTKRPLQEKLSLFWHSHFAVSDAKVEHAGFMTEYLQFIRKNANGKFGDLLKAMAKSPAMMRYLDMERAFKGRPNENFAREVMELFTMGIGNYSETDVKEVARALTGWGFIDTFWEGGKDNTERLMTLYRDKRPSGAFCLMPSMRDSEPKTILGQTKDFDGDQVLDMLAIRPETALFICHKLWEFFGYTNPDEALVARLASVFTKTGGDIKQVMYAIARSPEFFSEACYLKHYKSPADFVIGSVRQMDLGNYLLTLRSKTASPTSPISQEINDQFGHMAYMMLQMGLDLCYPADVSGWKWGKEWASPSMMSKRMQFHGMMIWNDKGPYTAALNTQKMMLSANAKTPTEIKNRFCEIFDLHISDDASKVLVEHFSKYGATCCTDLPTWAGALYNGLKYMSVCPDMHVS
jgi:uncharacterized protein (DUF1800 family)